ncbi:MAG: RNA polymerase factor sigma-54 [Verrucomicrobiales bacterium]|nr:RNA polymerase factor sigma-54 [Verrucomicrobiales bacterium]
MPEQRFEPSQSQSLQQTQTIAPQMQQSLQLLQAPTMELRSMIQQELETNPTLEDETAEISLEEQPPPEDNDDGFDEEFAEISQLDDDWREYLAESRITSPRRDDAQEKHQYLLDSLYEKKTLQQHLMDQLGLADPSPQIRKVGEVLIGSIDNNGFLQSSLEDLCFQLGIPLPDLEQALHLIQGFDPVGVGAESLRDCLLIQLRRLGKENSLEYRIVDQHLDDLARKRFPAIARKLKVTPDNVNRSANFIATLDPKPGSRFAPDTNTYVTADVRVVKDHGSYSVILNNDQIPQLRISSAYKEIMAQSRHDKKARAYIRDKIRSGKFLIRSIRQRQQTIEKIATEIVKRQQDFFDLGPAFLKPMNMAQVAEAVGVHETTVSRTVSGKYMDTPHGLFEMKYFFTSGYETASGASLSNTSVKQALAEIVENEDPKKPLSDEKLVTALQEQGIKIARRTIAKYRDALGILPSHLRKSY